MLLILALAIPLAFGVAALSLAYTPTPSVTTTVVEATRQVSAGVAFMPRSAFKRVTTIPALTASPANILAAYNALFGALIAGKKIFLRTRSINATGFASEEILTTSIVV